MTPSHPNFRKKSTEYPVIFLEPFLNSFCFKLHLRACICSGNGHVHEFEKSKSALQQQEEEEQEEEEEEEGKVGQNAAVEIHTGKKLREIGFLKFGKSNAA